MSLPTTHHVASATFKVLPNNTPQALARLGRQYTLFMACQPSPSVFIMTCFGSQKRASIYRYNFYPSYEMLVAVAQEKITRRIQHGYQLIGWSDDFPLLTWMRQKSYPFAPQSTYKTPPRQLLLPFADVA